MEIIVPKDRLAKALNIVSRITVSLKSAFPMLNNVLLRAEDGKLSMTATDMEMATVCNIGAKVVKKGVITAPAKLLAEMVANLSKDEEVKIVVKDGKLTVSAGKDRAVINGAAADDYPELPVIDEEKAVKLQIGVDGLKRALGSVMIASSNDTTRPALTGVYFNTFEGSLYLAATDGYRLAEMKFVDKVESEVFAIVPTSSLSEVLRSMNDEIEEVEILIDEAQVRFRMGEMEFMSKLIGGSFPDYRQLIPKKTDTNMVLERAECVRVTKLAAVFAREMGGSIVCEADKEKGVLVIGSVASEFGENNSEIVTKIDNGGKVTLNSRFLLDALNVVEEERIRFGFSGKLSPVVIKNEKNENYIQIIMPLKS